MIIAEMMLKYNITNRITYHIKEILKFFSFLLLTIINSSYLNNQKKLEELRVLFY